MDKLPALTGEPTPFLPRIHVKRTTGAASSMDLGRGCPYQCSFCTIINVQGRKSRCRAPEDVEKIMRENHAQQISCFFITDDNFARNSDWEALFDRLIHLRNTEFPDLVFTIQVDTLCHKIPNFIEKAAQAGVRHVFIGLENINPGQPDCRQETAEQDHRIPRNDPEMARARRHHLRRLYSRFSCRHQESIVRDVEIIKRELPLDILEFFFLTPLPGSEDHKVLLQKGIWMDPDMNKYDLNHRVSHHPKMSDEEWEDVYRAAWASYYTPEHARTIFRRAAACKASRPEMTLWTVAFFFRTIEVEGVQPLEGGAFRMKFRRDRRSGMKLENPLVFYPRYAWESVAKSGAMCACISALRRSSRKPWLLPTAGHIPMSRSRRRNKTTSSGSHSITRPRAARPRWRASGATM